MLKIKILLLFFVLSCSLLLPDPRVQTFDTKGTVLYICSGDNILKIFDIGDLHNIHRIGSVTVDNIIGYVQVDGERLYLDVKLTGLLIFDISNPMIPLKIGSFTDSYNYNYYLVKDSIAFATTSTGLSIININNLPTPNIITTYNLQYTMFDVRDSILCLGNDAGFKLFNIKDIYNPVQLSAAASGSYINGPLYINGNYVAIGHLFVGYHFSAQSVSLFDIADLANPKEIAGPLVSGGYASGSVDQFDIYKNKFFYGWTGASYQGGYTYGYVTVVNLKSLDTVQAIYEGTSYGGVKVDTTLHILFLYKDYTKLEIYTINEDNGTVQNINNIATEVNDPISADPINYLLEQNYPNPFNPVTTVNYRISKPGIVTLKVYDLLGKEIATLVNEVRNTGSYDVIFNASGLTSGVYIYQLRVNNYVSNKKMILLK